MGARLLPYLRADGACAGVDQGLEAVRRLVGTQDR